MQGFPFLHLSDIFSKTIFLMRYIVECAVSIPHWTGWPLADSMVMAGLSVNMHPRDNPRQMATLPACCPMHSLGPVMSCM